MQASQRDRERDRHTESSGQTGTCSGHAGDKVRILNARLDSLTTLFITWAYMSAIHKSSLLLIQAEYIDQNDHEGQPLFF